MSDFAKNSSSIKDEICLNKCQRTIVLIGCDLTEQICQVTIMFCDCDKLKESLFFQAKYFGQSTLMYKFDSNSKYSYSLIKANSDLVFDNQRCDKNSVEPNNGLVRYSNGRT